MLDIGRKDIEYIQLSMEGLRCTITCSAFVRDWWLLEILPSAWTASPRCMFSGAAIIPAFYRITALDGVGFVDTFWTPLFLTIRMMYAGVKNLDGVHD